MGFRCSISKAARQCELEQRLNKSAEAHLKDSSCAVLGPSTETWEVFVGLAYLFIRTLQSDHDLSENLLPRRVFEPQVSDHEKHDQMWAYM